MVVTLVGTSSVEAASIEASDNAVSDTVSDTVSSVMRDSSEGMDSQVQRINSLLLIKSNQKRIKIRQRYSGGNPML